MPADEPTLGEVMRTLARFEVEVGRRLDDVVNRLDRAVITDVYEAHRAAVEQRITAVEAAADAKIAELRTDLEKVVTDLEKESTERRADKRVVVGAVLAAGLALLVAALTATLGIK